MKKFVTGYVLLFSLAALTAWGAVTVVECVDAGGNTSFRDKCPPGTTKAGHKVLLGVSPTKAKSTREITTDNPVVLYSVTNCDACDLVRNALSTRSTPFNEKNVQDDAASQNELKSKTGNLTVPSVLIGATVLTGYNRSALDSALSQAGYPRPDAAAVPGTPPPEAQ